MSSELAKIEVVNDWETVVDASGQRRVRDIDIATRAGLAKPANVRSVIRTNLVELAAHGELITRRVRNSESLGNRLGSRGRLADEYLLNEDQSYALIVLLRTPKARELRITLVKLFGTLRRRELGSAIDSVNLDVAHSPCVGDVPNLRHEVDSTCRITARAAHLTLRRVHGFVRSTYRVPGVFMLSVLAWPQVKLTLDSLAKGEISVARHSLPQNTPQLSLLLGEAR